MSEARAVAVVTVSDRSFRGERSDVTGPVVVQWALANGWNVMEQRVVPDEVAQISDALLELCARGLPLVLTAGGTGLGPRDVTPEATRQVIDREVPGIAEVMRRTGAEYTPLAALSRALCGTCRQTLIVNLPGSPKGASQSLASVETLLPHAVDVLRASHFDHG
ncbi:MAG: MogA/MoaB family molybdenum cofactor biosynthesis protein [Firmicutes bacterium]|nr:MogA/MoaB family molybdenum cofactor biosynthesis protein [Bacillota bacterium]